MENKFKCMVCDKEYDFDKDKRPIVEVKNLDGSIGVYDGCCKPGSLIEIEKQSMESKYYTPDISEFYVGFEYEMSTEMVCKTLASRPQIEWFKQIFDGISPYSFEFIKHSLDIKSNLVRVKYLDREDIESLIITDKKDYNTYFKLRSEDENELIFQTYWVDESEFLDEEYIYWDIKYNRIKITHKFKTLFWGTIKNKFELKKLLTQLNIT